MAYARCSRNMWTLGNRWEQMGTVVGLKSAARLTRLLHSKTAGAAEIPSAGVLCVVAATSIFGERRQYEGGAPDNTPHFPDRAVYFTIQYVAAEEGFSLKWDAKRLQCN